MKLSEARHGAQPEVTWIKDLEYHELFEHDNVPFVEPKTGAIIISVDGKYEDSYVNIHTFDFNEFKWDIPWAVEILGTPSQTKQFLDLYFPHTTEDQIIKSQVWDQRGIDNVIKHVRNKQNSNLDEQVTRILEARYHKNKTTDEIYDLYVSFMEGNDGRRDYGPIVIADVQWWDDREYEGGQCAAVMMLWVIDASVNSANEEIPKFMKEMNLPFTSFDIDDHSVLKPVDSFKHSRLHATVRYEGPCPQDVTEAKYHGPTRTTSVSRHQVHELYKKHKTDTGVRANPQIQVQQKQMWPRSNASGPAHIIPMISLWYAADTVAGETDARNRAIKYMKDNNLPYTSVRSGERFGISVYQVIFKFGERDDLTEARYRENRTVEDVVQEYERIEQNIRYLNPEGYGYYDSEETGRVTMIHPRIDTEYNPSPTAEFGVMIHNCESKKEAEEKFNAFVRKFNIPYNDVEHGQDTGDKKFAFIIQYRTPHITEAKLDRKITNKDVENVYKQYVKHETAQPDLDDFAWIRRIQAGDYSDVFNQDPTIVADWGTEDDLTLFGAELTARWVIRVEKPINENKEKQRIAQYMRDLNLPYTEIKTNVMQTEISHESPITGNKDVIPVVMSEGKLIFKATNK